jgi:hypothetical protein
MQRPTFLIPMIPTISASQLVPILQLCEFVFFYSAKLRYRLVILYLSTIFPRLGTPFVTIDCSDNQIDKGQTGQRREDAGHYSFLILLFSNLSNLSGVA